jgi:Protein of unknown function (DUF2946)
MFMRVHNKAVSWIAIAAMLFASLAPSISHAFAAKDASQTLWQEICSVQGAKQIASNLGNPTQNGPEQNNMGMHFEHCPYCFSHAGSVGLPAVAPITLFLAVLNSPQAIEAYDSPVVQRFYQNANPPQAPPHLN